MKKLTEKNLLVTNGNIVTLELVELDRHDDAPVSTWGLCAPLTPELIEQQREELERKLQAAATLTDAEIPEEITEALGEMQDKILSMAEDDEMPVKVGFTQPFEICWN